MRLPADVARCAGAFHNGTPHMPCENCARRLSPSNHPRQPWMTPPGGVRDHNWCEFRIENVEVT